MSTTSPLSGGLDSKLKTKMAADSVQVGKVDNYSEKCANLFKKRYIIKPVSDFVTYRFVLRHIARRKVTVVHFSG